MSGRIFVSVLSLFIMMGVGLSTASRAAIVHESATLGTTGVNTGPGVATNQWLGSRFELTSTTQITGIGGNISGVGSFFGAIVALPGAGTLPTFAVNTIATNASASAVFNPPAFSLDILEPLSVTLNAGWYALIFGSGQFGATGGGTMPTTNFDLPVASYFFANTLGNWVDGGISNARFVVQGYAVSAAPLPAALPLFGTGLAVLGFAGWSKRRRRVAV